MSNTDSINKIMISFNVLSRYETGYIRVVFSIVLHLLSSSLIYRFVHKSFHINISTINKYIKKNPVDKNREMLQNIIEAAIRLGHLFRRFDYKISSKFFLQ